MALSALCPQCEGTGWIRVQKPQGLVARRCACHLKKVRDARESAFGLPSRLANKTFDNFSAGDYRRERIKHRTLTRAMNTAKNFVDEFPVGKRKGLLFYGGTLDQMTHLAVATLKRFLERGFSCMYCDYQLLLERLIDRADTDPVISGTSKALGQRILDVDVLLIDSLGDHRPIAWAVDTIGAIIKHRYFNEKCLLATTGLPLEELPRTEVEGFEEMRAHQALPPEWLGDRIGQASVLRLFEHCQQVCITVPDSNCDRD